MITRIRDSLVRHRKTLALLTGSQLVNLALGFGSSILWARCFHPDTYGSYQLVLSTIGIVSSFCLAGLSQTASLSAAKGADGNFSQILRLKLFASAIGSAVMLGYAFYLKRSGQEDVALAVAAVAPLLPGLVLAEIYISWLNSKRDFRLLSIAQVFPSAMPVIVLGLAAILRIDSLLFMAIGIQGLIVLGNIWVTWRTRRHHCQNDRKDPEFIRFGYHASAAGLLGWIAFADRFVVYEKLSAADLAVYSIAMIFPGQVRTIYSVIGQFITPEISAAESVSKAWETLRFKLLSVSAIFLGIGIVGFFLLPYLIPLLFSAKYAESAEYAKWIFFACATCAPAAYFGNILRAQRLKVFYYGYEIIQPAASLALYATLIRYGLEGMTWAQVARQFIFSAIMVACFFYYLRKERKAGAAAKVKA
jgi:O-antigen/teichoic acid export membrane protein